MKNAKFVFYEYTTLKGIVLKKVGLLSIKDNEIITEDGIKTISMNNSRLKVIEVLEGFISSDKVQAFRGNGSGKVSHHLIRLYNELNNADE